MSTTQWDIYRRPVYASTSLLVPDSHGVSCQTSVSAMHYCVMGWTSTR